MKYFEEPDPDFDADWLEVETIGGLRIWQITFLCLGCITSVGMLTLI